MKFLQIVERIGSYIRFEFSEHDADMVLLGDQVWSDGHYVEIYENIDEDDLQELLECVTNTQAFKGALLRVGIL